jgi:hypothetical protein
MSRIVDKPVLATTAFWLVALGAINAALAAPGKFHPEFQFIGRPLDLSPPARAIESLQKTSTASPSSSMAFPSSRHRPTLSMQESPQLLNLGAEASRPRSRVENLVRQVHKEGLPVARLFETKSTLVHVGLSPRGKPGLWFFHSMQ